MHRMCILLICLLITTSNSFSAKHPNKGNNSEKFTSLVANGNYHLADYALMEKIFILPAKGETLFALLACHFDKAYRRLSDEKCFTVLPQHIPHVLHIISLDDGMSHEVIDGMRTSFQRLHPEWIIMHWDHALIHKTFAGTLYNQQAYDEAFLEKNYKVMEDIVRVEILYTFGGLSLDKSVKTLKPFDQLCQAYTFFAGSEDWAPPLMSTAVIGACPQHPILQAYRDRINHLYQQRNLSFPCSYKTNQQPRCLQSAIKRVNTTGAGVLSWIFYDALLSSPEVCHHAIIFPPCFFNLQFFTDQSEKYAFSTYDDAGSWGGYSGLCMPSGGPYFSEAYPPYESTRVQSPLFELMKEQYGEKTFSMIGLQYCVPADQLKKLTAFFVNKYDQDRMFLIKGRDLGTTDQPFVRIPQKIHQIWLGGTMPFYLKVLTDRIKQCNPGWDYILWDEKKMAEYFPAGLKNQALFAKAYKRKNYAEASDILRSEILEEFGGVYVDCDFHAQQGFEQIAAAHDFFACFEGGGAVGNAIIGASSHHPIISRYRELMAEGDTSYLTEKNLQVWGLKQTMPIDERMKRIESIRTIILTGPGALTRALGDILEKSPESLLYAMVFPDIFFYYFDHKINLMNREYHVIGQHLFCGDWMEPLLVDSACSAMTC